MWSKREKSKNQNDASSYCTTCCFKEKDEGFPGGAVVENLPANAWDTG